MKRQAFYPGKPWFDTKGERIQAHGGSVFYIDGVYYWYGENKEKTDGVNGIWHWGVKCYSSTDLYNWDDRGIIIPPEPENPESSLHPSSCMDRPHILYNERTRKYVCWLKIMNPKDFNIQTVTILTADHILGPYTKIREGFRPLGMNAGDFDLAEAKVSLTVTNTGKRAGSQVIQLYIHERDGLFKRPEKELRNFAKVHLEAGESTEVTLKRKLFRSGW